MHNNSRSNLRHASDMKRGRWFFLGFWVVAASPLLAQAPAEPAASRGASLYQSHCLECHETHPRWRERKLATDWPSLAEQVRVWQIKRRVRWSDTEIDEVVRYMNATIYRFPDQAPKKAG